MPQFLQHDFFANYINAKRFKDKEFEQQLISDELGKLIVHKRAALKKAVILSGINLKGDTNVHLKEAILLNLDCNKTLKDNILNLIAQNNKNPLRKFKNSDGEDFQKRLTDIPEFRTELKRSLNTFKNATGDMLDQKIKQHSDNLRYTNPQYMKKVLYKTVLITVLLTVAIFFLGLWWYQNKKAVNPTPSAPPQQPPMQPQAQQTMGSGMEGSTPPPVDIPRGI